MPDGEGDGMNDQQPIATDPVATDRLRVWLRMLRLTRRVTATLRERLRVAHDITLPQFDVLAALFRAEAGLTMSALSEALMVSNGNVTGIVERLVEAEHVLRVAVEGDRRATRVCLTPVGRMHFARMADEHRAWVAEALSGLDPTDAAALRQLLDKANRGLAA